MTTCRSEVHPILKKPLKAEREVKKRHRRDARAAWQAEVKKLDGKCMNRECTSVMKRNQQALQAHHIKSRSLGGYDVPANGITLCPLCHVRVHCGYRHPIEGWITARQYMIRILNGWTGEDQWRWGGPYHWLKLKD